MIRLGEPEFYDLTAQRNRVHFLCNYIIQRDDVHAVQVMDTTEAQRLTRKGKREFSVGDFVSRKTPITAEDVRRHIAGEYTLGVYQLHNGHVSWVVYDIDDHECDGVSRTELRLLI